VAQLVKRYYPNERNKYGKQHLKKTVAQTCNKSKQGCTRFPCDYHIFWTVIKLI